MKPIYEQLNSTRMTKSKKSFNPIKSKLTFHLPIFIIIIQWFILLIVHIEVKNTIIINQKQIHQLDNINHSLQFFSYQAKEAKGLTQALATKKEPLAEIKRKFELSLNTETNRTKDLKSKLKVKERYRQLRRSITTFLTAEQLEKIEVITQCSFIRNCYSKTRDGLSVKEFHRNCDGLKPTVSLIQSNGALLSGMTYESWDGNGLKYDSKAFLFSLLLNNVYWIKEGEPAIHTSPDLFPTFGEEDIYVSESNSYIKSPARSYGKDYHKSLTINFTIRELEVFHMLCKR